LFCLFFFNVKFRIIKNRKQWIYWEIHEKLPLWANFLENARWIFFIVLFGMWEGSLESPIPHRVIENFIKILPPLKNPENPVRISFFKNYFLNSTWLPKIQHPPRKKQQTNKQDKIAKKRGSGKTVALWEIPL
jgi:hypothetical protein